MTADLSEAVRAAQAGDEEAFRHLYRSLQPGLLRYLTALVGADAEDVASEAWLQITRDLPTFEGGTGFRAWVATIGRHRAMDHLRRQNRRPSLPLPDQVLAELPADEDTAERAGESIATGTAIAFIAMLPRQEAEAVLLRTVVGLDAEGAARVLGKRAGAVRTAAHRGLRRLARMLEQRDQQERPARQTPAGGVGARHRVAGISTGTATGSPGHPATTPRER